MRIVQSAAESNTGRKRRHNEDSFVCEPPLFAVADGMGGAQAGEVASALAAAALREGDLGSAAGGEETVVELIQQANQRVHERAQNDASASGMGTTMTVALFDQLGIVVIGHVGDSRAYVLRNDALEQLTDDHSLVAELVRRGELTPAEAAVHPQRSVITRALGTDVDVDVDAFSVIAEDGDVFLICSDGLSTMVSADSIAELLRRNRSELTAASRALIRAANDGGGEDNITAVLFTVGADADDDGRTAELPALIAESDRDLGEEDTLHPEDHVMLPGLVPAPADTTMVVSADQVRAALAENVARPPEPIVENAPPAPFGRLLLTSLVIAALVGLIVLLVLEGLTR